jgi:pimeloyl-ACP methyl ester carboxylesterase
MQSLIDFGHDPVPWLDIRSQPNDSHLPTAHLSPANGIPAASYQSFINQFSGVSHFTAMNCRGAWPNQAPPPAAFKWDNHADDLIAAIESQHQSPVIGMGHSLGGTVTLLAAIKRPELFSKLVIIEPASLPFKFISRVYHLIPQWISFKLFEFIERTHQRQRIWSTRDAFIEKYQNHPTYRLFTETAMRDYAESGLIQRDDGQYELLFKPEWESFNFRRVHYLWDALEKTTHPTLLLRAEHSSLYSQSQFDTRNSRLAQNIMPQIIKGASHLATHETPVQLSEQIISWLNLS